MDYLQMFPETKEAVKRYKPEDRCLLYEAMMDYAFTGEEPDWAEDDIKWFVWQSLKQDVIRASKAVEKKRAAGRASAEQRAATQSNTPQHNATPSNTLQQAATPSNTMQHRATQANPEPEPEREPEREPKPEPEKDTAQARRERAQQQLDLFNRFWEAYPRKTAKQDAVKAFGKLKADEALLGIMLAALDRQKGSPQWADPQYIPHPATWLNGHRWEDEPVQGKGSNVAQTQYTQRQYQERKPGELPQYIKDMIENGEAVI